MGKEEKKKENILQLIGYAVAVLLILLAVATQVFTIKEHINLIGKPFPGFLPSYEGAIPPYLLPHWTGWGKGLTFPMIITEIDGKKFVRGEHLQAINSKPIGTIFRYKFYEGKKNLREVAIPSMRFEVMDFLQLGVTFVSISVIFLLCGILVFFLRPNQSSSWGVFLNGVFMAIFIPMGIIYYCNSLTVYMLVLFLALCGSTFLHISFSLFEEDQFFKGQPWKYGYLYIIPALILICALLGDSKGILWLSYLSRIFPSIYAGAMAFLILYVAMRTRHKSNNPVIRQRARLLLLGMVIMPIAAVFIATQVIFGFSISLSYLFIPLTALPISIAYGILRHNLFEVDEVVKRAVMYGTTIAITGIVYALIFIGLSRPLGGFAFSQSPYFILIQIIFYLYLLGVLRQGIQGLVDRLFFKKKIDYNRIFEEVRRELSVAVEINKIVEAGERIIKENLMLTTVELLIKDEKKGEYRSINGQYILNEGMEIVSIVKGANRLITHHEIINDPKLAKVRNRCLAQMAGIESKFLMPLYFQEELKGLIGIGERKSAEESFNLQDIDVLHFVSEQMAVALENAELYQEMEESKKELERLNIILDDRVRQRTAELEKRNAELEAANLQIATATQNKAAFLASMSHELRTPLNGILGFSQMVIDGVYGTVSDVVKNVLVDLEANGQDLLQTINDILDLSKIEAGKMELKMEKFSPRSIIELVMGEFMGKAEKAGIKLEAEYSPDLPMGMGEEKRIAQVLSVLVRNGIRWSKAKKIKIKVTISANAHSRLLFEVEDNGIGMPKERLEHLFEEHEIPEPLDIRDYRGVGLGLALAKKWIELHGGEMWVESETGKGTKFSFGLPLVKAQNEEINK